MMDMVSAIFAGIILGIILVSMFGILVVICQAFPQTRMAKKMDRVYMRLEGRLEQLGTILVSMFGILVGRGRVYMRLEGRLEQRISKAARAQLRTDIKHAEQEIEKRENASSDSQLDSDREDR